MVLGCKFQPGLSASDSNLKVSWHWISSTSSREVYRLDNGVYQDPDYLGRATLLREELENNWAKLKVPGPGPGGASSVRVQVMLFWSQQVLSSGSSPQISDLRISDSGTYQCLVQIGEEADYKEVLLSVTGDDPLLVLFFPSNVVISGQVLAIMKPKRRCCPTWIFLEPLLLLSGTRITV